jgi:outer membrane protein insertion porin family
MRLFQGLAVVLCLVWGVGLAQGTPKGQLDDIEVVSTIGTLDEALVGLVKVSISASVGDPVEGINLSEIPGQVELTGFFVAGSIKAVLVLENGRNILRITATPNPTIEKVEVKGISVVPEAEILRFLERNFNIAAGVMVSNNRLEEARRGLGQVYQQSIGFPFAPDVKFALSKPVSNKVTITFTVNENATVREVKVVGATLVPSGEILAQFQNLSSTGKFEIRTYFTGLRGVRDLYTKKGYGANTAKGYIGSGPSIEKSVLENGVLTIQIEEVRIAAIDATALGIDPATLSQKPSDYFNYQTLIRETRGLARGRDKQVEIQLEAAGEGSVLVTFVVVDAPAGLIQTIRILGNTALPTDRLRRLVTQRLGDTYNAQIAREVDYPAFSQAYSDAGFTLVGTPDVSYADGVYTIRVLEVRLVGYELKWRGYHRSQDRIILRELPKVGGLLDFNKIRTSFRNIQALNILKDIRPDIRPAPSNKPEEVILLLELEEGSTGEVLPGLTFSTLDGFAGSLSYNERNAWGVGHRMNLTFQAQPNDAGQVISGGFSYVIPWLDLNFLDFATNRTDVSVYFSSNVAAKRVVEFTRAFTDISATRNIYEGQRFYTTRTTGAGLSLGRQLFANFTIRVAFDFQYEQNFLETPGSFGLPLTDTNHQRPTNANNDAAVAAKAGTNQGMPLNNLTAYVSLSGEFNTRNREDFPTNGWLVQGSLGYGFGTDRIDSTLPNAQPRPLNWTQGTFGFRTYYGLGWDSNGKFGFGGDDRNLALAFRFNVGTLFGSAPSSRIFSIGGSTASEAINLRGLDFGDLRGDVYYTGSLEFRIDFGLQTAVTYGLLGIVWLDFGNAWGGDSQSRAERNGTKIPFGVQFGYGLGVQINLGFGGFQLPAIRLDYGWSAWNPGGKFYFRLGFPF